MARHGIWFTLSILGTLHSSSFVYPDHGFFQLLNPAIAPGLHSLESQLPCSSYCISQSMDLTDQEQWPRKPNGRLGPWSERYGDGQVLHFIHKKRCVLDPILPALDATHHCDDPPSPPSVGGRHHPLPTPSYSEADSLLYSERHQMELFAGLRTWEVALFNKTLHDGRPGGHQEADATSWEKTKAEEKDVAIKVDEASWHPIIRQDKWFDLAVVVKDSVPDPIPTLGDADIWSVDTPALWEELRINLELANRILDRAALTPWYVARLTGRRWKLTLW